MASSAAQPPATSRSTFQSNGYINLERCERDGHKLLSQGLATVVRIAQSDNDKYALEAGQWLVQYGETLMREKLAGKLAAGRAAPGLAAPADRDSILAELRGLYAKALPATLIVEAEPDVESLTPARMSQQPANKS